MEAVHYTQKLGIAISKDGYSNVVGRVLIGRAEGAANFCMRLFELAIGGHTLKHRHGWEHEVFFHTGRGEVWMNSGWVPAEAGSVVFIPGNDEHQIRNTGEETLTFVCVIPAGVPELL